jgi:small subunit ribosomal protein S7|uniref:Small ribosomal subunit protein uS7c n=1 Tax=Pycnococcus provasolii TaxID=41880 RepID=C0JWT8_9CHLO|nr:ribosomal protein S7 [Pycnococcus provasolii]ACK36843.1 ribosomal protein S7 [Pycnococcus provasolii]
MSKRKTSQRITADPIYRSRLVDMLINRLMFGGKRSVASRIVYDAMEQIQEQEETQPLTVLEDAVRNTTPLVEVKSRRVGGSTYQVPREVEPMRGTSLALRWIINSARSRSGRGMSMKLAQELVDASKNAGKAVQKRQETHKMAEANRAFAHFRG